MRLLHFDPVENLGGPPSAAAATAYTLFWPDSSRSAPTLANAHLSPAHFTPVKLVDSTPCADHNTRLLTLQIPASSIPKHNWTPIWSIFIKDDDIQVERPYTPLEGIDDQGCMKFWIKRYAKGEVGRWLHSKKAGEMVEIRGPVVTWPWQEDMPDDIVMVSGGTGITPFYQLLHELVLKKGALDSKTRFTLLHSSRSPAELPPPNILVPLIAHAKAHPQQLSISLFVDSLDGSHHPSISSSELKVGRVDQNAIEHAIGNSRNLKTWWSKLLRIDRDEKQKDRQTHFLICGPDPMVAAVAGPFGRNFSQGAVGGILGSMGFERTQVWKL
ncbi:uncharacterized protein FIBRA_01459 [Fibroporia radiculosa]|uniref:FAD-binding FR-type domain-containing protein n=1 Tax=Fibroporia radiculosa TaxID=599839 RepID=J4I8H9_9APHY|nr:uncharacterized protein FIBRA_01459 [Fibroporia radiculosa]CCL99441.1 predicted protein [Fibroporia radiculosa]